MLPEYLPDSTTRATNKLGRQFNRARNRGDIGGDMTIGEFGNINPVTSYAPWIRPCVRSSLRRFLYR